MAEPAGHDDPDAQGDLKGRGDINGHGDGDDKVHGVPPPFAPETLVGTAGDDTLSGGHGDDSLAGLDGADLLRGGKGADTIDGGAGNDTLSGGKGDDSLAGLDGNDLLRGGKGADTIDGGAGNDTLSSGHGADVLTGGAGADVFRIDGSAKTLAGLDRITDFTHGEDRLVFHDAAVATATNFATDTAVDFHTAMADANAKMAAGADFVAVQVGADVMVFADHAADPGGPADHHVESGVLLVGKTLADIGVGDIG
jgi:S-layer protein